MYARQRNFIFITSGCGGRRLVNGRNHTRPEAGFYQKGLGNVEMPPKPGVHPGGGDNFIHAMPAYIPKLSSAGVKWVSGFPENHQHNLPYISGLLILNDTRTGLPLSVMDCVWITAMRTGAATALSAQFLAGESSTVGVLGCGVQGRTNVEALQVLFPLKRVLAYDVDALALDRYCKKYRTVFAIEIAPVNTPKEAVQGCDMVVTAGPILKTPHATIQPGWLTPGAFASLVDFDSYWHGDALKEADLFCTDDTAQLFHYQQMGYFQQIPPLYADLGELCAQLKPGRQSDDEITLAANLGLALDDMAVAPLIYRRAEKKVLAFG